MQVNRQVVTWWWYWRYKLMIEERLILFVEQIGGFGKFFSAFSTILCNHPICVPISWKMLKNILQQKLHRILRRPLRPGFDSLRQPSPCLGLPFHPYLGIKVTTLLNLLYKYSLSFSCWYSSIGFIHSFLSVFIWFSKNCISKSNFNTSRHWFDLFN